MKWKLLLAVLLIVGITALLVIGGTGIGVLDSLRNSVGNFVSTAFRWNSGAKQFYIILTTEKNMFYGSSYKVSNSTFQGVGTVKELKINKAPSPVNQIDVSVEGMKGSLELTNENIIKVSADASKVVLNDLPILNLNIYFEMTPSTFSLNQFNTDKLAFPSISGEMKAEGGWIRYLSSSNIEIDGFKGSLSFEGSQATLEGLANKIIIDGKEVSITSK